MSVNKNTINLSGTLPPKTTYSTSDPVSTTGFVAGDMWYVTPLGTKEDSENSTSQFRFDGTKWVKTPGGQGTPITPELVPVKDFKTQAELDSMSVAAVKPNDGTSYICSDGTNKSNIFTWDEFAASWVIYTPSNGNVTTVTNPSVSTNAGKWKYDLTSDSWVLIETNTALPEAIIQPVSAGNIAFTSQNQFIVNKTGGPMFIVNDSVASYGDDTRYSAGDGSGNGSAPRKMSWNWSNCVDGLYSKSAQYVPKFVDASQTLNYALALDQYGKVWAMGNQQQGTGMCTTPTGTTAISRMPFYGFSPIGFFQANSDIIVSKIYTTGLSYNTTGNAFSAVLTNAGDVYVTGNGAWGLFGDGTTTSQTNWKKYPITNVKEVKLSALGIFTLTIYGELYYSGFKDYGWVNGLTGNRLTPELVSSNVKHFDFGGVRAVSVHVVKTDGTVWASGLNTNGQLGVGDLLTKTTLVQVPSLTDAKKVFTNLYDGVNSAILKTDGTIMFTGLNRSGMLSYPGAASGLNYSSYFMPSISSQGTIIDCVIGNQVVTLLTSTGAVWNSGHMQWRGMFHTPNVWADANKFQQVALPEAALAIRGMNEDVNYYDGTMILTTNYGIIGFGSIVATKSNNWSSYVYSPKIISEVNTLNNGIKVTGAPIMISDKVGNITGATIQSVTKLIDGASNQLITFTISYTGGVFGLATLSGSTVSGVGVTQISLQTQEVPILGSTGTFAISFIVNAADLLSSGSANQDYLLTLLINGN